MIADNQYISDLLKNTRPERTKLLTALEKASNLGGLTHTEVCALLLSQDADILSKIFETANSIKKTIYGNRIVLFAPLYISDYCVNRCKYCNYNHNHKFPRRRLTQDEVRKEVIALEKMGHKRLAIEAGEDDQNCPIEYILETIKTIYGMKFENGEIRRVNVNIAATTVENYKKLKAAGIGTYILFQETYHRQTYEQIHVSGPKSDYDYHLQAFDRAMQGGVDDVGGGVLFGLYDPYFEVLGLMLHNQHLEQRFGVGFHTISVPRIRRAAGAEMSNYPYAVDDQIFKKIVAIIRLAVPYTGLIISTRESQQMRKALINLGVSQMSGGSTVGVGGYSGNNGPVPQFEVEDSRSAVDIIKWLMEQQLIPSFCTACYRSGRTGDRFMSLAKSGEIKNVCHPNALMTLMEYALDYGDSEFVQAAERLINNEVKNIEDQKIRELTIQNIDKIKNGQRDFFV